jgi:hypothetical protein
MWRLLIAASVVTVLACGGSQRVSAPGEGDRQKLRSTIDAEAIDMETCATIAHEDLAYVCEQLRANIVLCTTAELGSCYEQADRIAEALRHDDWAREIADIAERKRAQERELQDSVDSL